MLSSITNRLASAEQRQAVFEAQQNADPERVATLGEAVHTMKDAVQSIDENVRELPRRDR